MSDVAIIIPHYNDIARLRRCLDALMPQVDDGIDVVVADNASPTSPEDALGDWSGVRLVVQPQKGAGPARNAGVAATDAPWLMFLDADCVPRHDWVARGREIADETSVIGGRVEVFDETPPPRSGAEAFETVFAFKMRKYLEAEAYLGSGNLVTSRHVFETTGGFRPAVSEDKDWSQRAAAAGFRLVYDDDLVVGHPSRGDWKDLRRKWQRLTTERFLLEVEGPSNRLAWAARALMMPASAVAHAPRILSHPDLDAGEKGRALMTLARIRLARMSWMLRQSATGRADL